MSVSESRIGSPPQIDGGFVRWVLIPAAVMSLGWGLRGYIGGGPHGAMIPGALVSILLCHYLRWNVAASSVAVAFCALGVGFGGNMTYGQTLGLIRGWETLGWGLLGTTLKGTVWGLIGGGLLGLGCIARHITRGQLLTSLLLVLAGLILGTWYVNVPQVLYFSDPKNPRPESWGGLLLAALLFPVYLQLVRPRLAWPVLTFAAYGGAGGAIGFGAGSLFLTWQALFPGELSWLPCWKFMEFFFGAMFGAALGLCVWNNRQRLTELGTEATGHDSSVRNPRTAQSWTEVIPMTLLIVGVYPLWNLCVEWLFPQLGELRRTSLMWTTVDVLVDFTGQGCLLMLLSRRWQNVAWQVAITMTFVATAIDWQRDLIRHHIEWDWTWRLAFVVLTGQICLLLVHSWQLRRPARLMSIFLLQLCLSIAVGYLMGIVQFLDPEAQQAIADGSTTTWLRFRALAVDHAIFTVLFIISLPAGIKELRRTLISPE